MSPVRQAPFRDVPDGWHVVNPLRMADLLKNDAAIRRIERLLAKWDADDETDYSIRRDLRAALNGKVL